METTDLYIIHFLAHLRLASNFIKQYLASAYVRWCTD